MNPATWILTAAAIILAGWTLTHYADRYLTHTLNEAFTDNSPNEYNDDWADGA